jgi:hypothetical protein
MKIEELRNSVHDLSNKLTLVDGKLKKALSLLEILSTLKMILNEESN